MAEKTVQRKLSRTLIIYVILFSSAITFVTTGYQLYHEYEQSLDAVQANFRQLEVSSLPGITEAVWAVDHRQL